MPKEWLALLHLDQLMMEVWLPVAIWKVRLWTFKLRDWKIDMCVNKIKGNFGYFLMMEWHLRPFLLHNLFLDYAGYYVDNFKKVSNSKKKIFPAPPSLPPLSTTTPGNFFQNVPRFCFLRLMDLKKKQNSMYLGTWIWENKILGHFEKNCQGVVVEEGGIFWIFRGWWWKVMGGRDREEFFFFRIWHFFFLIFNLKILPISKVSRCHLKAFFPRISKQGLLFDICDFSIFKI